MEVKTTTTITKTKKINFSQGAVEKIVRDYAASIFDVPIQNYTKVLVDYDTYTHEFTATYTETTFEGELESE